MTKNIWQELKKPILILAPMEDVTDTVFRQIVADCGQPDIMFTEFTSVEGMFSKGEGIVGQRLQFTTKEKPLIAQIWGKSPEFYYQAAQKIAEMGFDGIDINMGCPVRNITQQGCCSALIKNPELAKEIILATQKGSNGLPVSVKTRIGFSKIQTEEWASMLLQLNLTALTIHGRTAAEMSKVPAHWDEIAKVVKLRDQIAPKTLIIGNGDVMSLQEAYDKVKEYGVDGIMIGRGIFHNVFLFNKDKDPESITIPERVDVLLKHLDLYEKTWGKGKHYQVMKKFFKAYINNFPGAAELRAKLMERDDSDTVREILHQYMSSEFDQPISAS